MVGSLLLRGSSAIAVAVLSLSLLGRQLERQVGLELLYAARGEMEAPDGALIVALDRDSVGWLQRNVDHLDRVAEGLDDCLTPRAREALRQARNVNQIPRALHTCLIRRLASRHPRVIAFDINFNADTPDDAALADAIRSAGNVLLFERLVHDGAMRRLRPSALLVQASMGSVSFQTDGAPGATVTGYPTRYPVLSAAPAMPVEVWRHHVGAQAHTAEPLPDFQLVWFYGPAGTIPTVSLRRVFEADQPVGLPADLSRTSVFVGASNSSDTEVFDHYKVPVSLSGSKWMGGVEIAATAFLNLLHGQVMSAPSPIVAALFVFCFTLAVLIFPRLIGSPWDILLIFFLSATYTALTILVFTMARFWMPVFVPVILVTPMAVLATLSTRWSIARGLIEKLAPRAFARELLKHPDLDRRAGRLEEATILFADMIGSTALAERLGTQGFRRVMDKYYGIATTAVDANDGMIVEYTGDGVLALFTAELAGPHHATKACRTAREFSTSARRRNNDPGFAEGDSFLLRIGIHSGTVVTGPTGVENRYNFNALGDSVNVAARLEEHGKRLRPDGTDIILLSHDTRVLADIPDELLHPLGSARLRGRRARIKVYRLLSRQAEVEQSDCGPA